MADATVPGFGDLLALFGGANPMGAVTRQFDQIKRLSNELVTAVENVNRTMESLNATAQRFNGFLDDVEGPVRALMPQVTRSIKALDAVVDQLNGPLEMIAPGLSRLASTLSSPVFIDLPAELGNFLDTLGDLAKRLQPLTQMAESAGGLFGLRPLASLRSGSGRQQPLVAPAAPPPSRQSKPERAAPKKATTKKAAPRPEAKSAAKTATKKSPTPKR